MNDDAQLPPNPPATVVVEPLPMQDDEPHVLTNAEYTRQLIAEHETPAADVLNNYIKTLLDEIDTASSIPGADGRIRNITRKIRAAL